LKREKNRPSKYNDLRVAFALHPCKIASERGKGEGECLRSEEIILCTLPVPYSPEEVSPF